MRRDSTPWPPCCQNGLGKGGGRKIDGDLKDGAAGETGLSLLFAAGQRPSAEDVARLSRSVTAGGSSFGISHRPGDEEGWLELISSGLTFDLAGLGPAPPAAQPVVAHRFGLSPEFVPNEFEAVSLLPGVHLSGGEGLIPVVRVTVGLAATLCELAGVAAVVWHPARSALAPAYFSRVVNGWLEGGPFPGLGLAALQPASNGRMVSEGLAFLTGQELVLAFAPDEPPSSVARLALRLMHELVGRGGIHAPAQVLGTAGEQILIEPSPDGRRALARRLD